jgi:hypothetical protein
MAAALVAVLAAAIWASIVPVPDPNLFASIPSLVLLAVVAVAVMLLGPGAFSLDARLFGLREIIIPPARTRESRDRTYPDRGSGDPQR